jgi:magnesium chelatase family protein
MSLATLASRSLDGMRASAVQVEVHLSNGLPAFTLVGLADTEVKEARERVRSALAHCGLNFPHNKRVTVNLAPADVPKASGRFDLPIALGILAADGVLDAALLAQHEFAGELSLAGELRPIRGALAMALAMQSSASDAAPARTLVLPEPSALEAARVPGLTVRAARTLLEVVQALRTDVPEGEVRPTLRVPALDNLPLRSTAQLNGYRTATPHALDLSDVKGQAAAKRALEVAAAGGHSLLMSGPPGTGKSMLAQRLLALLPPMQADEALQSAAVASLSSAGFDAAQWQRHPWRAPHHSASAAALVGGGSPPRPGEISLAHGGLLFLDELPEFNRTALEALREPLETGHITLSRAARQATFPARFQLVAAMNPCPCGWLGAPRGVGRACPCTPDQVARYRARLSGPLLDRIDLHVDVLAVAPEALLQPADGTSANVEATSPAVQARAAAARARQWQRQGCCNAQLAGAALATHASLDDASRTLLERAAGHHHLSARAVHRILRVARTLADLDACAGADDAANDAAGDALSTSHIAEALQYRPATQAP